MYPKPVLKTWRNCIQLDVPGRALRWQHTWRREAWKSGEKFITYGNPWTSIFRWVKLTWIKAMTLFTVSLQLSSLLPIKHQDSTNAQATDSVGYL